MAHKREVPSVLQKILKMDAVISSQICALVSKIIRLDQMKGFLQALEVSCNGILWIGFWLVYIWFYWHRELFQMQVNFFMALITDILLVAVTKAYFRRRRPPGYKSAKLQGMGPDIYSFPSGHVSRASIIFLFFTYLFPVGSFWSAVILVWACAVALSRLLLHSHYLLDIFGGFCLSVVNYILVSWLLVSQSTSYWLIEYITDERTEGGEYHV